MSDAPIASAEAEEPKLRKPRAPVGMPARVKIQLEENDDIPPTGLFLGHNGTGYLLRTGEPIEVPRYLLEILDHAVMSAPTTDPGTKQVVGYRERMRYPYRFVS